MTEAGAMKVHWILSAHMLAAQLTKITGITVAFLVLLDADKRKTEGEHYRKVLCQGQCQRHRERKDAITKETE